RGRSTRARGTPSRRSTWASRSDLHQRRLCGVFPHLLQMPPDSGSDPGQTPKLEAHRIDRRGRARKRHDESGAATLAAAHLDGAAHRIDELLHDRQAEAGADLALGRVAVVEVEAIECVRKLLVRETRPGV